MALPRIALVLRLMTFPLAAQSVTKPTLASALLDARSFLCSEGKFAGDGAAVLTSALEQPRFILLGEDHVTREIPQFAAALCDVVHPDAYAVESGPEAAAFVNGLLHSPDRLARMSDRAKAHPNNMAFLDIREENDLAAHCAAASRNPHFTLWGLDQEFVGSAGTLLDAMLASNPGPKSKTAIAAVQAKERAADQKTRDTGDPGQLFLLASTDADTAPLEDAIATDGTPGTKDLLHEFLISRRIYRLNAAGAPESNSLRATLLKQHFLTDYVAATTDTPATRVLLKFGDDHLGKGFNVLHQRDLGNFIAELADGEGAQSLHILVLGARGEHALFAGYAKPLAHQPFVMADDPGYKWIAPAVADLLPQSGPGATLTLFDLRKLRFRDIDMPPDWQRIVYSYDLFVLMPELTPAALIQ